jgi:hypothetical protein
MKTKRGIKTPLLFLKFYAKIGHFLVKTRFKWFVIRIVFGGLHFFSLFAFPIFAK